MLKKLQSTFVTKKRRVKQEIINRKGVNSGPGTVISTDNDRDNTNINHHHNHHHHNTNGTHGGTGAGPSSPGTVTEQVLLSDHDTHFQSCATIFFNREELIERFCQHLRQYIDSYKSVSAYQIILASDLLAFEDDDGQRSMDDDTSHDNDNNINNNTNKYNNNNINNNPNSHKKGSNDNNNNNNNPINVFYKVVKLLTYSDDSSLNRLESDLEPLLVHLSQITEVKRAIKKRNNRLIDVQYYYMKLRKYQIILNKKRLKYQQQQRDDQKLPSKYTIMESKLLRKLAASYHEFTTLTDALYSWFYGTNRLVLTMTKNSIIHFSDLQISTNAVPLYQYVHETAMNYVLPSSNITDLPPSRRQQQQQQHHATTSTIDPFRHDGKHQQQQQQHPARSQSLPSTDYVNIDQNDHIDDTDDDDDGDSGIDQLLIQTDPLASVPSTPAIQPVLELPLYFKPPLPYDSTIPLSQDRIKELNAKMLEFDSTLGLVEGMHPDDFTIPHTLSSNSIGLSVEDIEQHNRRRLSSYDSDYSDISTGTRDGGHLKHRDKRKNSKDKKSPKNNHNNNSSNNLAGLSNATTTDDGKKDKKEKRKFKNIFRRDKKKDKTNDKLSDNGTHRNSTDYTATMATTTATPMTVTRHHHNHNGSHNDIIRNLSYDGAGGGLSDAFDQNYDHDGSNTSYSESSLSINFSYSSSSSDHSLHNNHQGTGPHTTTFKGSSTGVALSRQSIESPIIEPLDTLGALPPSGQGGGIRDNKATIKQLRRASFVSGQIEPSMPRPLIGFSSPPIQQYTSHINSNTTSYESQLGFKLTPSPIIPSRPVRLAPVPPARPATADPDAAPSSSSTSPPVTKRIIGVDSPEPCVIDPGALDSLYFEGFDDVLTHSSHGTVISSSTNSFRIEEYSPDDLDSSAQIISNVYKTHQPSINLMTSSSPMFAGLSSMGTPISVYRNLHIPIPDTDNISSNSSEPHLSHSESNLSPALPPPIPIRPSDRRSSQGSITLPPPPINMPSNEPTIQYYHNVPVDGTRHVALSLPSEPTSSSGYGLSYSGSDDAPSYDSLSDDEYYSRRHHHHNHHNRGHGTVPSNIYDRRAYRSDGTRKKIKKQVHFYSDNSSCSEDDGVGYNSTDITLQTRHNISQLLSPLSPHMVTSGMTSPHTPGISSPHTALLSLSPQPGDIDTNNTISMIHHTMAVSDTYNDIDVQLTWDLDDGEYYYAMSLPIDISLPVKDIATVSRLLHSWIDPVQAIDTNTTPTATPTSPTTTTTANPSVTVPHDKTAPPSKTSTENVPDSILNLTLDATSPQSSSSLQQQQQQQQQQLYLVDFHSPPPLPDTFIYKPPSLIYNAFICSQLEKRYIELVRAAHAEKKLNNTNSTENPSTPTSSSFSRHHDDGGVSFSLPAPSSKAPSLNSLSETSISKNTSFITETSTSRQYDRSKISSSLTGPASQAPTAPNLDRLPSSLNLSLKTDSFSTTIPSLSIPNDDIPSPSSPPDTQPQPITTTTDPDYNLSGNPTLFDPDICVVTPAPPPPVQDPTFDFSLAPLDSDGEPLLPPLQDIISVLPLDDFIRITRQAHYYTTKILTEPNKIDGYYDMSLIPVPCEDITTYRPGLDYYDYASTNSSEGVVIEPSLESDASTATTTATTTTAVNSTVQELPSTPQNVNPSSLSRTSERLVSSQSKKSSLPALSSASPALSLSSMSSSLSTAHSTSTSTFGPSKDAPTRPSNASKRQKRVKRYTIRNNMYWSQNKLPLTPPFTPFRPEPHIPQFALDTPPDHEYYEPMLLESNQLTEKYALEEQSIPLHIRKNLISFDRNTMELQILSSGGQVSRKMVNFDLVISGNVVPTDVALIPVPGTQDEPDSDDEKYFEQPSPSSPRYFSDARSTSSTDSNNSMNSTTTDPDDDKTMRNRYKNSPMENQRRPRFPNIHQQHYNEYMTPPTPSFRLFDNETGYTVTPTGGGGGGAAANDVDLTGKDDDNENEDKFDQSSSPIINRRRMYPRRGSLTPLNGPNSPYAMRSVSMAPGSQFRSMSHSIDPQNRLVSDQNNPLLRVQKQQEDELINYIDNKDNDNSIQDYTYYPQAMIFQAPPVPVLYQPLEYWLKHHSIAKDLFDRGKYKDVNSEEQSAFDQNIREFLGDELDIHQFSSTIITSESEIYKNIASATSSLHETKVMATLCPDEIVDEYDHVTDSWYIMQTDSWIELPQDEYETLTHTLNFYTSDEVIPIHNNITQPIYDDLTTTTTATTTTSTTTTNNNTKESQQNNNNNISNNNSNNNTASNISSEQGKSGAITPMSTSSPTLTTPIVSPTSQSTLGGAHVVPLSSPSTPSHLRNGGSLSDVFQPVSALNTPAFGPASTPHVTGGWLPSSAPNSNHLSEYSHDMTSIIPQQQNHIPSLPSTFALNNNPYNSFSTSSTSNLASIASTLHKAFLYSTDPPVIKPYGEMSAIEALISFKIIPPDAFSLDPSSSSSLLSSLSSSQHDQMYSSDKHNNTSSLLKPFHQRLDSNGKLDSFSLQNTSGGIGSSFSIRNSSSPFNFQDSESDYSSYMLLKTMYSDLIDIDIYDPPIKNDPQPPVVGAPSPHQPRVTPAPMAQSMSQSPLVPSAGESSADHYFANTISSAFAPPVPLAVPPPPVSTPHVQASPTPPIHLDIRILRKQISEDQIEHCLLSSPPWYDTGDEPYDQFLHPAGTAFTHGYKHEYISQDDIRTLLNESISFLDYHTSSSTMPNTDLPYFFLNPYNGEFYLRDCHPRVYNPFLINICPRYIQPIDYLSRRSPGYDSTDGLKLNKDFNEPNIRDTLSQNNLLAESISRNALKPFIKLPHTLPALVETKVGAVAFSSSSSSSLVSSYHNNNTNHSSYNNTSSSSSSSSSSTLFPSNALIDSRHIITTPTDPLIDLENVSPYWRGTILSQPTNSSIFEDIMYITDGLIVLPTTDKTWSRFVQYMRYIDNPSLQPPSYDHLHTLSPPYQQPPPLSTLFDSPVETFREDDELITTLAPPQDIKGGINDSNGNASPTDASNKPSSSSSSLSTASKTTITSSIVRPNKKLESNTLYCYLVLNNIDAHGSHGTPTRHNSSNQSLITSPRDDSTIPSSTPFAQSEGNDPRNTSFSGYGMSPNCSSSTTATSSPTVVPELSSLSDVIDNNALIREYSVVISLVPFPPSVLSFPNETLQAHYFNHLARDGLPPHTYSSLPVSPRPFNGSSVGGAPTRAAPLKPKQSQSHATTLPLSSTPHESNHTRSQNNILNASISSVPMHIPITVHVSTPAIKGDDNILVTPGLLPSLNNMYSDLSQDKYIHKITPHDLKQHGLTLVPLNGTISIAFSALYPSLTSPTKLSMTSTLGLILHKKQRLRREQYTVAREYKIGTQMLRAFMFGLRDPTLGQAGLKNSAAYSVYDHLEKTIGPQYSKPILQQLEMNMPFFYDHTSHDSIPLSRYAYKAYGGHAHVYKRSKKTSSPPYSSSNRSNYTEGQTTTHLDDAKSQDETAEMMTPFDIKHTTYWDPYRGLSHLIGINTITSTITMNSALIPRPSSIIWNPSMSNSFSSLMTPIPQSTYLFNSILSFAYPKYFNRYDIPINIDIDKLVPFKALHSIERMNPKSMITSAKTQTEKMVLLYAKKTGITFENPSDPLGFIRSGTIEYYQRHASKNEHTNETDIISTPHTTAMSSHRHGNPDYDIKQIALSLGIGISPHDTPALSSSSSMDKILQSQTAAVYHRPDSTLPPSSSVVKTLPDPQHRFNYSLGKHIPYYLNQLGLNPLLQIASSRRKKHISTSDELYTNPHDGCDDDRNDGDDGDDNNTITTPDTDKPTTYTSILRNTSSWGGRHQQQRSIQRFSHHHQSIMPQVNIIPYFNNNTPNNPHISRYDHFSTIIYTQLAHYQEMQRIKQLPMVSRVHTLLRQCNHILNTYGSPLTVYNPNNTSTTASSPPLNNPPQQTIQERNKSILLLLKHNLMTQTLDTQRNTLYNSRCINIRQCISIYIDNKPSFTPLALLGPSSHDLAVSSERYQFIFNTLNVSKEFQLLSPSQQHAEVQRYIRRQSEWVSPTASNYPLDNAKNINTTTTTTTTTTTAETVFTYDDVKNLVNYIGSDVSSLDSLSSTSSLSHHDTTDGSYDGVSETLSTDSQNHNRSRNGSDDDSGTTQRHGSAHRRRYSRASAAGDSRPGIGGLEPSSSSPPILDQRPDDNIRHIGRSSIPHLSVEHPETLLSMLGDKHPSKLPARGPTRPARPGMQRRASDLGPGPDVNPNSRTTSAGSPQGVLPYYGIGLDLSSSQTFSTPNLVNHFPSNNTSTPGTSPIRPYNHGFSTPSDRGGMMHHHNSSRIQSSALPSASDYRDSTNDDVPLPSSSSARLPNNTHLKK